MESNNIQDPFLMMPGRHRKNSEAKPKKELIYADYAEKRNGYRFKHIVKTICKYGIVVVVCQILLYLVWYFRCD